MFSLKNTSFLQVIFAIKNEINAKAQVNAG
jgi:hypothetical protein